MMRIKREIKFDHPIFINIYLLVPLPLHCLRTIRKMFPKKKEIDLKSATSQDVHLRKILSFNYHGPPLFSQLLSACRTESDLQHATPRVIVADT